MTDTIKTAMEKARVFYEKNIPCFTMGPPGVGKSEMWMQIAEEKEIEFIDLRLAQMDPVDLRGLPTIVTNKRGLQSTVWTRPDFWPDDPDWEGIILLDELADCGRAMQSASYQVVLDRRAGPHVLPKGAYIAAAGNSRSDKAGAQAMSTALASRFAWVDVVADVETLLDYAARKDWHHFVRGFLKTRPNLVHNMEGEDLRAFPCPRQWERVSRVCEAPRNSILGLASALIGSNAAGEFNAYLKVAIDLPDFEDVIADPKRCRIPHEASGKYAMATLISRFIKRANVKQVMQYIGRPEFGRDFEIVTVLDATRRDTSLMITPEFVEFANKNKELRLG